MSGPWSSQLAANLRRDRVRSLVALVELRSELRQTTDSDVEGGAVERSQALDETEHDYVAVWGEWYSNPGFIDHNDRYKAELRDGSMQPTKLTFAEDYQLLIGRPFPLSKRVFVSYCNCFAVANRRIALHAALQRYTFFMVFPGLPVDWVEAFGLLDVASGKSLAR